MCVCARARVCVCWYVIINASAVFLRLHVNKPPFFFKMLISFFKYTTSLLLSLVALLTNKTLFILCHLKRLAVIPQAPYIPSSNRLPSTLDDLALKPIECNCKRCDNFSQHKPPPFVYTCRRGLGSLSVCC